MSEKHKIVGGILQLIGVACLTVAAFLAFGAAAGLATFAATLLVLGHLTFHAADDGVD